MVIIIHAFYYHQKYKNIRLDEIEKIFLIFSICIADNNNSVGSAIFGFGFRLGFG